MKANLLDNILIICFAAKLLWNVIVPAVTEWRHRLWRQGALKQEPQSFQMVIGFEIATLIIWSAWHGYKQGSFRQFLILLLVGAGLIAASYALCALITRFIRSKP
jgi:hypothetical protein